MWGDNKGLPISIDVDIFYEFHQESNGFAQITLLRGEIEELIDNYELPWEPVLLQFLPTESIFQWCWDAFCREPVKVEIVKVNW